MTRENRSKQGLAERVAVYIGRHGLVSAGETVVVGVSGGPDSACLLHVLAGWRDTLGIGLHVAHLNHTLRGAEADGDAEYVSGLARALGVTASLGLRDVRSYRTEHRLSLEEAARQVRYEFLAETAVSVGAKTVALGHTADDQAETVLMRLVRGAGALGLQGMQPLTEWGSIGGVTGLRVIRPLLEASRPEVEAYCQQHNLAPREDSSNLLPSFMRNRIRHELIPLLQSYNPKINQALLRTADSLGVELDFLEHQVSQVWDSVVVEEGKDFVLRAEAIKSLHPAVQRHLLRRVLRRLLGDLDDIEWKHVEQMRNALVLRRGKRVVLPRGLTLHVEDGAFRVASG